MEKDELGGPDVGLHNCTVYNKNAVNSNIGLPDLESPKCMVTLTVTTNGD